MKLRLSELSKQYYNEYSTFMGIMRGTVDLTGLKRVHIRILYALYTLPNRNEVKTASVVGETIGKYHPHGDQSISDAIETLVKQGLIKGFGNWGNFHMGLEYMKPAAIRYTSIGWTNFLDFVFEHIKQVKFVDAQIDPNKEPVVLPTPIPLCLINFGKNYSPASLTTGISPKIKTLYPQFKLSDLISFITECIDYNWNDEEIKNSIAPPELYLGDNVELTYHKDTVKDIWFSKSSFSVKVKPVVLANDKTREVQIKALTSKRLFSDANMEKLSSRCSVLIDKSTPDCTDLYFKFTRTQYFEEFLNEVQKYMEVNLNFSIILNDFSKILKDVTLYDWIKFTYFQYRKFTESNIKQQIETLTQKISELNLIRELRPYIQQALQHQNSTKKLLELTKDKFNSEEVTNIIKKHNIKKLLDTNIEIKALEDEIQRREDILKNLDSYLKAKYSEMIV